MNQRADSVTISTAADQADRGGEIPASALHFLTGQQEEAQELVMQYHYSKRIPSAVKLIGSLHLDLYWKALGRRGERKAKRLGLT